MIEGVPVFELLTFGTLTSAVYLAHKRSPENPHIKDAVLGGVEGCVVLHAKTPLDVIRWLRDFHNLFHGGQSYGLMQFFKDTFDI